MRATPQAKLTQSMQTLGSCKAAYRFVNNASVTHEGIIAAEVAETHHRVAQTGHQLVLAVQDTTSFNFSQRHAVEGLGVLDDNRTPGFFAQSTVAVSDEGVPLGLLGQQVWVRQPNHALDQAAHKHKPITQKKVTSG